MTRVAGPKGTKCHCEDAIARLEGFFESLLESEDGFLSFCEHANIALPAAGPNAIWKAFLAHYLRNDGKADEKRVASDFATWAPIAADCRLKGSKSGRSVCSAAKS
jgi:hypothetical protein